MRGKVVDSSAVAAVLFKEPDGDLSFGRMAGSRLLAPSLLRYELANVCLTKMRRQPDQRAVLRANFSMLDELAIELVDVDHAAVLDLAHAMTLTAYDASYLWLADHAGAELVTLDRRLAAADAGLRARRLC